MAKPANPTERVVRVALRNIVRRGRRHLSKEERRRLAADDATAAWVHDAIAAWVRAGFLEVRGGDEHRLLLGDDAAQVRLTDKGHAADAEAWDAVAIAAGLPDD